MFRAVKELTSAKPKTPVVKNNAGETIAQPEEAAEIVAGHFFSIFFMPQQQVRFTLNSRQQRGNSHHQ
jgi:hypothetical protein